MSDLGNKEVLARNLKRLMSENNIDRNKMCDDLKLKYSTVSEWLSANKYPQSTHLRKIKGSIKTLFCFFA